MQVRAPPIPLSAAPLVCGRINDVEAVSPALLVAQRRGRPTRPKSKLVKPSTRSTLALKRDRRSWGRAPSSDESQGT